jgi:hypothetical protein
MKVIEVIAQTRDNLQDADANYWTDSELLDLYNECKRHLAAERKERSTNKTVPLITDVNEYSIDGVLRYISATDSALKVLNLYPDDTSGNDDKDGVIIQNYNSIYVNNPVTDVTLTLKVIAFPDDDNLSSTIRSGDENAYKYYMLSKAYEKESDMENFQKSSYFRSMFTDAINYIKKSASLNYISETQVTKGYYY